MASTNDKEARDRLDQALTRAVHGARKPQGLPAPLDGRDEPSDDELLRVIDGSATPDERARVSAAEKSSAFTRERLEVLREALTETGHAAGAIERVARYVFVMAKDALELLRSATEPVAMPAAVAVRSGAAGTVQKPSACYYEFVQPFQDVETHLKIEHVTRADSTASIDVQIRIVGSTRGGARVSLLRNAVLMDSVPVGDDGAATFSGLAQDRYEIVVRKAGQEAPVGKVHLDFLKG